MGRREVAAQDGNLLHSSCPSLVTLEIAGLIWDYVYCLGNKSQVSPRLHLNLSNPWSFRKEFQVSL